MRRVGLFFPLLVAAADTSAQTAPRPVELPPPDATLDAELTQVSSIRELSDGRVLVVDRSDRKLLVADWSKLIVTQVGRTGAGPGEYQNPVSLLPLPGDSTILPDTRNGRWLLLVGPTITMSVSAGSPVIAAGGRNPIAADRHGHVIATRGTPARVPTTGSGLRADSMALLRISRSSGSVDTVTTLAARPTSITIKGPADKPTEVSVRAHPLATGELATLFPDGWIGIARLDPYRVEWIGPDGGTAGGSPLPYQPVRLDDREKRAFAERVAARTGNEVRDPSEYPDWPALFPPFLPDPLLRGPDGRLWIRKPPTSASPGARYDVVDRRGALVATVAAGRDVEIVGFGRASVYTTVTNEDGIQHLEKRPLPRL